MSTDVHVEVVVEELETVRLELKRAASEYPWLGHMVVNAPSPGARWTDFVSYDSQNGWIETPGVGCRFVFERWSVPERRRLGMILGRPFPGPRLEPGDRWGSDRDAIANYIRLAHRVAAGLVALGVLNPSAGLNDLMEAIHGLGWSGNPLIRAPRRVVVAGCMTTEAADLSRDWYSILESDLINTTAVAVHIWLLSHRSDRNVEESPSARNRWCANADVYKPLRWFCQVCGTALYASKLREAWVKQHIRGELRRVGSRDIMFYHVASVMARWPGFADRLRDALAASPGRENSETISA